jgi:phospholipid-binding lipoprotein MlaA
MGFAGDQMMSPPTYIGFFFLNFIQASSTVTFEKVNDTSFKLGDYALLTKSAMDPYLALKDAFVQYRKNKVRQAQER